jgi:hypothetical protein
MVSDRGDRCLLIICTCSFWVKCLFPFPLVTAKWIGDYFEIRRYLRTEFWCVNIFARYNYENLFCPQIKSRWDHRCAIILAHRSLPVPIMNQIWTGGFFSCSGRVSFYAPNIRYANKLARYKNEGLVWSASLYAKQIAYSWRERKRKYVSQWQTARSKWKWTSIATVPDLCPTTVKILTHLISRYHLPLSQFLKSVATYLVI